MQPAGDSDAIEKDRVLSGHILETARAASLEE